MEAARPPFMEPAQLRRRTPGGVIRRIPAAVVEAAAEGEGEDDEEIAAIQFAMADFSLTPQLVRLQSDGSSAAGGGSPRPRDPAAAALSSSDDDGDSGDTTRRQARQTRIESDTSFETNFSSAEPSERTPTPAPAPPPVARAAARLPRARFVPIDTPRRAELRAAALRLGAPGTPASITGAEGEVLQLLSEVEEAAEHVEAAEAARAAAAEEAAAERAAACELRVEIIDARFEAAETRDAAYAMAEAAEASTSRR